MAQGSIGVIQFYEFFRYASGRGARNALAAAGIGLIAATAAVAPSYAQQAAQDRPGHTAACMKYREDNGDRLQCEYNASVARTEANKAKIAKADQRIANADQRISAANTQIAALESEKNCVDVVSTAFKNGRIDKDELRATLGGRKPSEYGWPALAQKFNLKCG